VNSTLEAQQETAERMFYAAVGAPVVFGQKARDFGKALFNESFEDFESAGREFAAYLQDNKVVGQIQESVDVEQFQDKVEALREQLESLLASWRDQFDAKSEAVTIEVDKEAPKKTSTKKTTADSASTAKKTAAGSKK
jgi:hypothetical protein